LDAWLNVRGYDKGAIVTPQALYELGADWYATRLDIDWQPTTARESTTLFAKHGLTGAFWELA
jgi:hypothetical protein